MPIRIKTSILALTLILILAFSLVISGCTSVEQQNKQRQDKTGLQIYSMSTGLGALNNDNTDQHRLTYAINLTNEDDKEVYIQWIEPILGNGIKDKVITEELRIAVEKPIAAKGNLEIEGVVVLDTQGLSKKEIVSLEPFITGIKIGSEKVIIINTQGQNG